MALTQYQRGICRLIADNRKAQSESYVAGGAALNLLLPAPRLSKDIDLFHDTNVALQATWQADKALLESNGYELQIRRELPTFVDARVVRGPDFTFLQWTSDSTYRFFPLTEHDELGLTMHAFDLATNKVLALVGRIVPRDWIDALACHTQLQPLGYLIWAACGKDAGYNPYSLLGFLQRRSHISRVELEQLEFEGDHPDPVELVKEWKSALAEAEEIIASIPPPKVGTCIIDSESNSLYKGTAAQLREAVVGKQLIYHSGCMRGAYPEINDKI